MSQSDYERIGDAFSRVVERGEGPPTVRHWVNEKTGRRFFTRAAVGACLSLPVAGVVATVKAQRQTDLEPLTDLAGRLVIEWRPDAFTFRTASPDSPPDQERQRVGLTVAAAGPAGLRLWLVCPRCARRVGVVYASPWDAQGRAAAALIGCRACLGLTDASRQRHKSLDWSLAVLGRETSRFSGGYRRRGTGTVGRAAQVFERRWARLI
jgi:hypothetical protein